MPLTKFKKHDHLLLQYNIIGISNAILRKYSTKHGAALSAAVAIPRGIGREVTVMLREVMMRQQNRKATVLLTEIF
jgi:hypothetical protein